jgi:membrane dipeptidase
VRRLSWVTSHLEAAAGLLSRHPLIDGHNDLPWELRQARSQDLHQTDLAAPLGFTHTDLPRLTRGRVGAQFWSVFVPASLTGATAVTTTLEQIEFVHRMARSHPGALELARTAGDVERIFAAGKIASLLGAEGGHSIACSMSVLRAFFELGVRYLTLTHNANVPWADSATDQPAAGGLTAFGRAVVGEMQRLGMLADLSHVSAGTMHDTFDTAEAPVIFSHSSARALCDHPRNVPDEVLARLPGNHGVCMVTFVPAFVSQECRDWDAELAEDMRSRGADAGDRASREAARAEKARTSPPPHATIAQVADHIDHVRAVAGVDHVGIGGDFDGTDDLPAGLTDVSCYPALFAELLARGWTEEDCGRLAGGNILRVMREAESAARAISARRPPSTLRIEDTDGAAGQDAQGAAGQAAVAG